MADIGRFDIAHSLKQAFDLRGEYGPGLGEGIVPTVQLMDLELSPFGPALPWGWGNNVGAVAANYGYVVVQPAASLPDNAWISVHRITVEGFGAAEAALYIASASAADVPAGLVAQTAPRSLRQNNLVVARTAPEVAITLGNAVAAPFVNSKFIRVPVGQTQEFNGEWAIGRGGALIIASQAVNTGFAVSLDGRVHLTSAR